MRVGTTDQIIFSCLDTIYSKMSTDKEIILAYRKYRELLDLPRYAEWNYYNDDPKMQKAMYLSLLDELHSQILHTT